MKDQTGHLRLVRSTDRRVTPDRRHLDRGGRRSSDYCYVPNPPCDGCESTNGLRWVCGSDDFDQYHCQICGYRVFLARAHEWR